MAEEEGRMNDQKKATGPTSPVACQSGIWIVSVNTESWFHSSHHRGNHTQSYRFRTMSVNRSIIKIRANRRGQFVLAVVIFLGPLQSCKTRQ